MTENVFPKINGDILYASEVNRIQSSIQNVKITGSGIAVISGTAQQTLGSYLINTYLNNPLSININYAISGDGGGAVNVGWVNLQLSGLQFDISNNAGSGTGATGFLGRALFKLGSPGFGYSEHTAYGINVTQANLNAATCYDTKIHNNIYTGSQFVVIFNTRAMRPLQLVNYEIYTTQNVG